MHMLVVDDDPMVTTLVSVLLTEAGHDVRTADTYDVACGLLDTVGFDVVISDHDLADPNGRSGTDLLTSLGPGPTRRVLISGHARQPPDGVTFVPKARVQDLPALLC